jgi:hypothetical protein
MMWGVPRTRGLVERTVDGLLHAMERAVSAEAGGNDAGWMQRLDPRVKLAGLVALVAASASTSSPRCWQRASGWPPPRAFP